MPVSVDAELKRRDATLALVNWLLIADADQPVTSLSDPVIDQGVRDRLTSLLARLPATLDGGALRVAIENWVATIAVTGTVALDAPTLAALETINANIIGTVPVSGTVAVSNMVAQGLTDTQLRATSVPVSGPVTDAQLRASAVPVSGPLTDTQLRAAVVPVNDPGLPDTLGQKTSAGSTGVVIASDQSAVPISGTVTANLGTLNGAATETTLATRLSESDFDTKAGSLTETAPASDTASSGLNGRLQRIAQRLTSLIALLPGSLGQKAKVASLAVVIASDQDALPVTGTFWQATQPVSGTVAISNPTTNPETGLAKDATLTGGTAKAQIVDSGGQSAEVNSRADGIVALEVSDDMTSGETFRQTLVASTDTTITFSQPVRLVRIKNEDLTSTVFVRDGAISSDTPSNAEMVGIAPAASLPNTEYYPYKTTTIHLRSAGTPTVSATGFY